MVCVLHAFLLQESRGTIGPAPDGRHGGGLSGRVGSGTGWRNCSLRPRGPVPSLLIRSFTVLIPQGPLPILRCGVLTGLWKGASPRLRPAPVGPISSFLPSPVQWAPVSWGGCPWVPGGPGICAAPSVCAELCPPSAEGASQTGLRRRGGSPGFLPHLPSRPHLSGFLVLGGGWHPACFPTGSS